MNVLKKICAAAIAATALHSSQLFALQNTPSNTSLDINQLIQEKAINHSRLMVKFKKGVSLTDLAITLQAYAPSNIRSFYKPRTLNRFFVTDLDSLNQWRVLEFSSGSNIGETFQELRNNPLVDTIVPDAIVNTSEIPNDLDSALWGLNNTGQTDGTVDADIDMPEAWDLVNQADDVVVAVIDTGIDYTHPDLADNIWVNAGEIAGNGIDDDNNGFIDDIHGWDFSNNDNDPMDDHFHGTHVAGTISAVGDNATGVVGVARTAKLMAIKFMSADGIGYTSDAIDAILYAADNGAALSNNSWGGRQATYVSEILNEPLAEAIRTAAAANHLFVAAAGNDSTMSDGAYSNFPSGLTEASIISVAATDHNDDLANFSNYGLVEVDLSAPGVNILSTDLNHDYRAANGTSMAAPHVAGVAALLLSIQPDLSPAEVKAILLNSTDSVQTLDGNVSSGGRLNAYNAVSFLTEAPSCSSFIATPQNHVDAARATRCGFLNIYVCANGSNENIGMASSGTLVELVETSSGYFETGQCASQGVDIPPVITLEGSQEQRILIGSQYSAPSATAYDREDGNISTAISIDGSVNVNEAGSYVINYNVTDSRGNNAVTERRLIHVLSEDTPPYIGLFGTVCEIPLACIPLIMEQGQPYEEAGYIAFDEIDGDLTDQVQVTGSVLTDTQTIGSSYVTYDVLDSSGQHNISVQNRYVFVLDSDIPYIEFKEGSDEIVHALGTCCIDDGYEPTAVDLVDGFFRAELDDGVNQEAEGIYNRRYYYTDSDGFTGERIQIVHIVNDVTPPEVTLNGAAEITLALGETFYDERISISDDIDNSPQIHREGTVDTDTVGTYQIRYWGSDESGNTSASLYRTVYVVAPCTEFSDTPANHISSGRAHTCGTFSVNACANGSNDDLGSRFQNGHITIRQTNSNAGYYELGNCT